MTLEQDVSFVLLIAIREHRLHGLWSDSAIERRLDAAARRLRAGELALVPVSAGGHEVGPATPPLVTIDVALSSWVGGAGVRSRGSRSAESLHRKVRRWAGREPTEGGIRAEKHGTTWLVDPDEVHDRLNDDERRTA